MLRKKNHHSQAKTISKLTIHSQFLQNYFSRSKIKILTWQINVRTLYRVSELAQCPMLSPIKKVLWGSGRLWLLASQEPFFFICPKRNYIVWNGNKIMVKTKYLTPLAKIKDSFFTCSIANDKNALWIHQSVFKHDMKNRSYILSLVVRSGSSCSIIIHFIHTWLVSSLFTTHSASLLNISRKKHILWIHI